MAKAHILPISLYGDALKKDGDTVVATADPEIRPIRSRIGEYDCEILCRECEARFQELDDYAAKVFMQNEPIPLVRDGDDVLAVEYPNVEPKRMIRFFEFLLWRMGASDRPMFKSVWLGPYQERLRRAIFDNVGPASGWIEVIVQKFDRRSHPILGPARREFDGINGYSFVFAGHSIWVKVDNRKIPKYFEEISLIEDRGVIAICIRYSESADLRAMLRLAAKQTGLRKLNFGGWGKIQKD